MHNKRVTYEIGRGNLRKFGLQSYDLRSVAAIGNKNIRGVTIKTRKLILRHSTILHVLLCCPPRTFRIQLILCHSRTPAWHPALFPFKPSWWDFREIIQVPYRVCYQVNLTRCCVTLDPCTWQLVHDRTITNNLPHHCTVYIVGNAFAGNSILFHREAYFACTNPSK